MQEELMQPNGAAQENPVPAASKKGRRALVWIILLCILLGAALFCTLRSREIYNLFRHGVRTVHCRYDKDHDLIDDYTDIMLGARRYIETQPVYDASYFAGGYPPEGSGVCADVIWQAFKAAGYDFKAMIDADIYENTSAYPLANGLLDTNIDFRRVVNLKVFFERHGQTLTTDISQIDQWQPGDLVFYKGHVAIVSDRRNEDGVPWVIHHTGRGAFEEDALEYKPITGHYRWIPIQ